MSNAGKKVRVHYTGTLDDGTKFDSSRDRGVALDFVCMAGQMIPGFDAAVAQMEVGEVRDVHLEPKDAYGERDDRMMRTTPISALPGAEKLKVGDKVMLSNGQGHRMPATVTTIEDGKVTFDLNHELAGKALNFNIELLEVMD